MDLYIQDIPAGKFNIMGGICFLIFLMGSDLVLRPLFALIYQSQM
jgi:hypothetical protein